MFKLKLIYADKGIIKVHDRLSDKVSTREENIEAKRLNTLLLAG